MQVAITDWAALHVSTRSQSNSPEMKAAFGTPGKCRSTPPAHKSCRNYLVQTCRSCRQPPLSCVPEPCSRPLPSVRAAKFLAAHVEPLRGLWQMVSRESPEVRHASRKILVTCAITGKISMVVATYDSGGGPVVYEPLLVCGVDRAFLAVGARIACLLGTKKGLAVTNMVKSPAHFASRARRCIPDEILLHTFSFPCILRSGNLEITRSRSQLRLVHQDTRTEPPLVHTRTQGPDQQKCMFSYP